jgi:hypothetical protein
VTIVFSDITRSASLWEFNAEAMRDATILHNSILRDVLKKHRGYEVIFLRYYYHHHHRRHLPPPMSVPAGSSLS